MTTTGAPPPTPTAASGTPTTSTFLFSTRSTSPTTHFTTSRTPTTRSQHHIAPVQLLSSTAVSDDARATVDPLRSFQNAADALNFPRSARLTITITGSRRLSMSPLPLRQHARTGCQRALHRRRPIQTMTTAASGTTTANDQLPTSSTLPPPVRITSDDAAPRKPPPQRPRCPFCPLAPPSSPSPSSFSPSLIDSNSPHFCPFFSFFSSADLPETFSVRFWIYR